MGKALGEEGIEGTKTSMYFVKVIRGQSIGRRNRARNGKDSDRVGRELVYVRPV